MSSARNARRRRPEKYLPLIPLSLLRPGLYWVALPSPTALPEKKRSQNQFLRYSPDSTISLSTKSVDKFVGHRVASKLTGPPARDFSFLNNLRAIETE
ncbi:MAG: hypothetical protein NTW45_01920 [Rhodocyclales bacterium]|nr:hypothetical protein [Rhodocyclales bacterium]